MLDLNWATLTLCRPMMGILEESWSIVESWTKLVPNVGAMLGQAGSQLWPDWGHVGHLGAMLSHLEAMLGYDFFLARSLLYLLVQMERIPQSFYLKLSICMCFSVDVDRIPQSISLNHVSRYAWQVDMDNIPESIYLNVWICMCFLFL